MHSNFKFTPEVTNYLLLSLPESEQIDLNTIVQNDFTNSQKEKTNPLFRPPNILTKVMFVED